MSSSKRNQVQGLSDSSEVESLHQAFKQGSFQRACHMLELTYRSITHINGATRTLAVAADAASAPSLNPRFAVFHLPTVSGTPLGGSGILVASASGTATEGLITVFVCAPPLPSDPSDILEKDYTTAAFLLDAYGKWPWWMSAFQCES